MSTESIVHVSESSGSLALPALPIEELVKQVQLIQQAMKLVMIKGEHYGIIPGTSRKRWNPETQQEEETAKPVLLKPGAEKLCFLFRLAPEYFVEETERPSGHIIFRVACRLSHINTGRFIGAGFGICTTLETKYRFRSETIMTEHGSPRIVPEVYWKDRDPKHLGGPQYGTKKERNQWVVTHKVEYENPYDYYNTAIKMACKRALVAATLNATAASDIFTQDLEDFEEMPNAEDDAEKGSSAPAPPKRGPGRPRKAKNDSKVVDEPSIVEGVVSGTEIRESTQGTRFWCGLIGATKVFTSDPKWGQALHNYKDQAVRAQVEKTAKLDVFRLLNFEELNGPESESTSTQSDDEPPF